MSLTPSQPIDLAEALANAFPNSRPTTREVLSAQAQVRQANLGELLTRQGERRLAGLVLDGFVGLIRTTVDGRQLMPRLARARELFLLLPIGRRPAGSDAVALSVSRVALWPAETVRQLAAGDAGFAVDVLDQFAGAFDTVIDGLDGLLHQNALRRVARVLHLYHPLFFGDQAVLTRAHLPIIVGTSREMTGRVLRRLHAVGLVQRVGRDGLRLLDEAGLERLATEHQSDSRRETRTEQFPRQRRVDSAS